MNRIVALSLAFLLASCATSGAPELESCLADPEIMPLYRASTSDSKVLVGGVDARGQVHCYWEEFRSGLGLPHTTAAWKQCKADTGSCTVIANVNYVQLNFVPVLNEGRPIPGYGYAPTKALDLRPIWHLVGQFAEAFITGYAMGTAYGATAPRTIVVSPASRERYRCTPDSYGAGQPVAYTCR